MSSFGSPEGAPDPNLADSNPELYAELLERCDVYWDARPECVKKYEDPLDKPEFVEREVAFIDMVHGAVHDLAVTHPGPITVLLDCDETFVRNDYGTVPETMHVRPGTDILVEALETDEAVADRFDIGLLTSRAQEHLDEEVVSHEFGYMKHLGDRLNPEFLVSSRPNSPIYEPERLGYVPEYGSGIDAERAVAAVRSIIRPEIAESALSHDHEGILAVVNRGHWYDPKLAIVAHLAETHPDRGFVFVDDLPFPASIDPAHPQVRGVALGSDAGFYA